MPMIPVQKNHLNINFSQWSKGFFSFLNENGKHKIGGKNIIYGTSQDTTSSCGRSNIFKENVLLTRRQLMSSRCYFEVFCKACCRKGCTLNYNLMSILLERDFGIEINFLFTSLMHSTSQSFVFPSLWDCNIISFFLRKRRETTIHLCRRKGNIIYFNLGSNENVLYYFYIIISKFMSSWFIVGYIGFVFKCQFDNIDW